SRGLLLTALLLLAALPLATCGGGPAASSSGVSGVSGISGVSGGSGASGGQRPTAERHERHLSLYIWTNYLPAEVAADFEHRTGITLDIDTYSANEALLDKLQSEVSGYDLVVPSDYMLKILIPQGLVQPLDHARLPHFANLDPHLLDRRYDPGNRHSIPYLWGTTGLGYDKTKVQPPPDSWQALFDPRYAGRILMLDDVREAFGAALRLDGRSLNERDPEALRRAARRLKDQKRLVRTYNSADFANLLAAGDVDLAQGYNGELAKVVALAPRRLAYVVPKEGGTLWIDNLALAKSSRHTDAAYAFLDYLLLPEVAARIVNGVHYASANRAAWPLVDPRLRNDPAIYPPQPILDRCELMEDLGATTPLLDQLWTEIKAQ
ncbi:MAG: spermidine/putrescine ABC transporter substrate-binding protein, partial [Acidobacteriota bacterium]|nr:spermidine/putrescine ABC transporter substrate-binding protein [Acidobacteriota bacterium]